VAVCASHRRGWLCATRLAFTARPLPSLAHVLRRVRLGFVKFAVRRMVTTACGIEALAAARKPAFERLVAAGIPMMIRMEQEWIERHAEELDAALG
jgi:hypothetical protein